MKKQIQDFEREQEELRFRITAASEGRMKVTGAIERSQTVKEQLNVRIRALELQLEEVEKTFEGHKEEKDSYKQKIQNLKEKKEKLYVRLHKK